jgi:polyisoprenoid-binding protein YceI
MTQTKYFLLFTLVAFVSLSCKKTSGDKASVSDASTVEKADGTAFQVDLNTSQVLWQGSKPTGTHDGFVKLSQGEVIVDNGQVTGGSFTMDMNTITNTDLDGNMKSNLEAHLKGTTEGKEDDFFNIALYPTARFEITKISALSNDPEASHLVYGNLTLRDKTKEIGFKANIKMDEAKIGVSTPQFTINRADWGIKFMSKSFFDDLKDKFINDEVGLKIQLEAAK